MESPPEIGTLVHIGLHWWAAWSFKDLCISDFWDGGMLELSHIFISG